MAADQRSPAGKRKASSADERSPAGKRSAKYQIHLAASQGKVIGDYNIVRQYFLGGLSELPTDYASRIDNFLTAYIGTKNEPVPFGGRTSELSALNDWLDAPGTSPYLLIAAPAGRGNATAISSRFHRSWLQRTRSVDFPRPAGAAINKYGDVPGASSQSFRAESSLVRPPNGTGSFLVPI